MSTLRVEMERVAWEKYPELQAELRVDAQAMVGQCGLTIEQVDVLVPLIYQATIGGYARGYEAGIDFVDDTLKGLVKSLPAPSRDLKLVSSRISELKA